MSRSRSAMLDLPELDAPLRRRTCPVPGVVKLMGFILAWA